MQEGYSNEVKWYLPVSPLDSARILFIGFIMGAAGWLLGYGLWLYVFQPLLCQSREGCGGADAYAMSAAMCIMGAALLIVFIKDRVYRPLLVVLVVMAALWGLGTVLLNADIAWYWAMLLYGSMAATACVTFWWCARIVPLWAALLTATVLLVLVRLMIVA